MTTEELEKFWNEKHPKKPIVYAGRTMSKICPTCNQHTISNPLLLDVKQLVSDNDLILQQMISQHNLKAATHDQTIHRIQKFVVKQIKYLGDDQNQGTAEYWQFPFETVNSQVGDCEDGAILIASLALNAGVPAFRIRVVAGLVKPHEETAPEGGHGYVSYLRESDNEHVAIDWCYYEDSNLTVDKKPLLKTNKLYKDIWFSFNHQNSWGEGDFDHITERLKMIK